METRMGRNSNHQRGTSGPHSLGKQIEWKPPLPLRAQLVYATQVSPLAGETN